MESIKLYCLPFAGGNKYSYRLYEQVVPEFIQLVPLEYPGRGARLNHSLLTDVNEIANDLFHRVQNSLGDKKYAIYGHSMGGLVGYLLTKRIVQSNYPNPVHLFITGTQGPSAVSRGERKMHLLDKGGLIDELRRLDGCPEEILTSEEMFEYFQPILRADFTANELYRYQDDEPLDIPFTVITGTDEELTADEIQLWQKESISKVDFRRLPGRHFFIFEYYRTIVEIIAQKLSAAANPHPC